MTERDVEINDDVIEKVADKVLASLKPQEPFMTLSFSLPRDRQEADLAFHANEMSIVLWRLLCKRSENRHTEDEEERNFWNRFSSVVYDELERAGLSKLIDP